MKKTLFILPLLPIACFSQKDSLIIINESNKDISNNLAFEEKKDSLTLEKIKGCIAFPQNSEIYKSLAGLCDVWFLIEKEKGIADDKALIVVLEKLGDKILSMR